MDILNMVFTAVFTVEMVLKLIAFKPRVSNSNTEIHTILHYNTISHLDIQNSAV